MRDKPLKGKPLSARKISDMLDALVIYGFFVVTFMGFMILVVTRNDLIGILAMVTGAASQLWWVVSGRKQRRK